MAWKTRKALSLFRREIGSHSASTFILATIEKHACKGGDS